MTGIIVRKANEQDYEAVCKLFRELDEYHLSIDPATFQSFDGPARPFELFKSFLTDPDKFFIVAVVENNLAGFLNGQLSEMPPYPMYRPRRFVTISNLFVTSSHRKCGIGARLIEQAKNWAGLRRVDVLQLTVFSRNHMAVDLYKKLGFVNVKQTMEMGF